MIALMGGRATPSDVHRQEVRPPISMSRNLLYVFQLFVEILCSLITIVLSVLMTQLSLSLSLSLFSYWRKSQVSFAEQKHPLAMIAVCKSSE